MNVLERAIIFATEAHKGQTRKLSPIPYILHPLEVSAIAATLTEDLDTMAAAVLHDTVEDCGVDPLEIREKFGKRVYALVQSESEDKLSDRPPAETWLLRKEESLLALANTKDLDVKIIWLSDKLSNIRSFYREYLKKGDLIWQALNQKDPAMQYWYYKSIAESLTELKDSAAYKEDIELIYKLFEKGK